LWPTGCEEEEKGTMARRRQETRKDIKAEDRQKKGGREALERGGEGQCQPAQQLALGNLIVFLKRSPDFYGSISTLLGVG
jgi:hypothetical protein